MSKIFRFLNTFRQGLPKFNHYQDVVCGGVTGTIENMWFDSDIGQYVYAVKCSSGIFTTNESSLEIVEDEAST